MRPFQKGLASLCLAIAASAAAPAGETDPISINDVIWTTPGKNSADSMPLGR
jgi:hypothetical protein